MADITSLNSTIGMSVTNSVDFGAMLLLVLCIGGLCGVFMLITSIERYTKFFDTLYKFLYTLKYTAVGLCIVVIGYVMYIACSVLVSVGGGIDPVLAGKWMGVYVVITVVGYAATKLWMRIKDMHARYVALKVGI